MESRYKYFIIVFFLYFSHTNLYSQSYTFRSLTTEDGLSNNKVNTVLQDKSGFIWFGTNDGLSRYDGYGFKIFRNNPNDSTTISDNCITALFEDSRGLIWVGTKLGIIDKYDCKSEKFTHLKLYPNVIDNNVKTIYEDSKRNIWIGTHLAGLYKITMDNKNEPKVNNLKDITNNLSHKYVTSVIEDVNGNILVGTYSGLNIFNPEKPQEGVKNFYYLKDDPNSLTDNIIWALSKSSLDSNLIYIGTYKGLTIYNSKKLTFKRIQIDTIKNVQYGASCGYVIDEIENGEKILWVNSYGGLSRVLINKKKSVKFIHNAINPTSLINNQINKIIKDRTGVLWIVTENGVSYITSKSTSFNAYEKGYNSFLSLKTKNITALSKITDDKIWIGTDEGLYILKNITTNPSVEKFTKCYSCPVWSIAQTMKNELWIGTYGKGLKKVEAIKNKIVKWNFNKEKFPGQSIFFNSSLLEDSKKNIWIGYWGIGIARLNTKTGQYKFWLNDKNETNSISSNSVWSIKEDRLGRIWVGTLGGGLNLFQDKNGGVFSRFLSSNSGISSNKIYSIIEAKYYKDYDTSNIILWLGTDRGLDKFVIQNSNDIYNIKVSVETFLTENGLIDNTIKSIVEDNNGNLWLGTDLGISFFDTKKKGFLNFSKEDGINGTVMNKEAVLKLNDGLILFGSTKGLNILDPKKIKLSSYKPNLVITDFQIFNKSIKIGNNSALKNSIIETKKIELKYNQNVFSFEFAALDYNSPQNIQYAYMMERFDKDWIQSGKRRYVTYTNLNPGKYIFKIKSTNADGIWNDKIKSIAIIIKPPWWKTWWAYFIYSTIFIYGIFLFRKYEETKRNKKEESRIKNIIEKEKLKQTLLRAEAAEYKTKILESEKEIEKQQIRNRISADLHDEIGSSISSIILLSSLINKNQKLNDKVKKYINEIHNASKLSAQAIRDIVWVINPTSDNVAHIFPKMVETANVMLGAIEHKIETINFDTDIKLHPEVKRNIFLIYKEILTNIVKHSEADFVKIKITEENKFFKFFIEDNGVGFDTNNRNVGVGLKNMNYRTKQINGNLEIISEKNIGTVIKFSYRIT